MLSVGDSVVNCRGEAIGRALIGSDPKGCDSLCELTPGREFVVSGAEKLNVGSEEGAGAGEKVCGLLTEPNDISPN